MGKRRLTYDESGHDATACNGEEPSAVVLTRRIFDASTASAGMRPAESQTLLALALAGSLRLTDPPGESVRGLASMLA
jgi:hypothetical protein